ncbi:MAG: hypothetical protein JJV98_13955 [Desulfosarcina sp.]|nr:hypothetical protein [Desulfobacterales bacterium]
MSDFQNDDMLTKVSRYNLIRNGRMLYIDVHEAIQGSLAAPFVAVPNLINIIARPRYQGTGQTEREALDDCLRKVRSIAFEDIFPHKATPDTPE